MTHILLSLREILGIAVRRRLLMLFAVFGALALALPLAACGRKGALDPPPGGYTLQGGSVRTPVTRRGKVPEQESKPETKQEYDQDGRPILPEGQNRRLPADWLID
jgi:predicted small lipoprotein YifL